MKDLQLLLVFFWQKLLMLSTSSILKTPPQGTRPYPWEEPFFCTRTRRLQRKKKPIRSILSGIYIVYANDIHIQLKHKHVIFSNKTNTHIHRWMWESLHLDGFWAASQFRDPRSPPTLIQQPQFLQSSWRTWITFCQWHPTKIPLV